MNGAGWTRDDVAAVLRELLEAHEELRRHVEALSAAHDRALHRIRDLERSRRRG